MNFPTLAGACKSTEMSSAHPSVMSVYMHHSLAWIAAIGSAVTLQWHTKQAHWRGHVQNAVMKLLQRLTQHLHGGRCREASPPMGLMLAQAPLPSVICMTLAVTSSSVVTMTSSALQTATGNDCSSWHNTFRAWTLPKVISLKEVFRQICAQPCHTRCWLR